LVKEQECRRGESGRRGEEKVLFEAGRGELFQISNGPEREGESFPSAK